MKRKVEKCHTFQATYQSNCKCQRSPAGAQWPASWQVICDICLEWKSKSAKPGVSRASASVTVAFAHTHIYTPTEDLNFSHCHLIRCSNEEHEGHVCHLNKWEVFPLSLMFPWETKPSFKAFSRTSCTSPCKTKQMPGWEAKSSKNPSSERILKKKGRFCIDMRRRESSVEFLHLSTYLKFGDSHYPVNYPVEEAIWRSHGLWYNMDSA